MTSTTIIITITDSFNGAFIRHITVQQGNMVTEEWICGDSHATYVHEMFKGADE